MLLSNRDGKRRRGRSRGGGQVVNCTFFCSFPLVHGLVVAWWHQRKRNRPFVGRVGRQPVIDGSGRLIVQRLMASPVVVKVQILGQIRWTGLSRHGTGPD